MDTIEYKERLEWIVNRFLTGDIVTNLLIIFDINKDHRKDIFYEFISNNNWRVFQPNIHEVGDNQYDYLVLNNPRIRTLDFHDTLKSHIKKKLILDNDAFLDKGRLLGLLEGAICSNPDSSDKWPVRLYGKEEFYFWGEVIILTTHAQSDLKGKRKYFYIWRDCLKL